ncbi:MAG: DUF4388 domain-containing protein [Desulfobulbaceae bacterium]|nr:DUF4388 domain-containing protein [Desulfobulbaceae bacterium]
MQYRNAVFVVTEERACPVYNVGDEFRARELMLHISRGKPACLSMLTELLQVLSTDPQVNKGVREKISRGKFECGGCMGIIRFEPKKTGEFATLQMKLLAATERRSGYSRANQAFATMRDLGTFSELDDEQLHAFCSMGQIRQYEGGEKIVSRGEPADRLFILLSGRVGITGEQAPSGAELVPGELFGELSLVANTVYSTGYHCLGPVSLLVLTANQFKSFLGKHPALHVFFYRQLIRRAENRVSHLDGLSASLSGKLSDVVVVDLCQLINSSQKTGKVQLLLANGDQGEILFNEGELVAARHGELTGRDAFFSLIGRDHGTFNFLAGLTPEEKNLPVIGGFMSLVMEGMQKLDEQGS